MSQEVKFSKVPQKEQAGDVENNDDENDYLCGIGTYRPAFLQRYSTSRVYAIVFSMLGVFQGAFRAYLIGTLSTVEKRFSMSSKKSNIILIADDISPLFATIIFALFLKKASKPLWVASGMLLTMCGCISCLLPYLIYGPGTHLLKESDAGATPESKLCRKMVEQNCEESESYIGPLAFFFMGNFLNGLGGSAYYIMGTIYMDDNVKKKNSALYFGTVYACRMLGPTFGFLLSYAFLDYYEIPTRRPDISAEDPRWIGAWWIGFIVIGIGILLVSLPMFLFPKKIRAKSLENKEAALETDSAPLSEKIDEIVQLCKRLGKNPIYMYRTIGNIFFYIGVAGYFISFPKYIEHTFRKSASDASLITGPTYVVSHIIGIIIGAAVIHKFCPRPVLISIHCVLVNVLTIIGMLIVMFISCQGTGTSTVNVLDSSCNQQCYCTTAIHNPVCDQVSGIQYFSPCFAGCLKWNETSKHFYDCSCLQHETSSFKTGQVVDDMCNTECLWPMIGFIVVMFCIKFFSSTSYVGSTLILLRAVSPTDKAMALTVLMGVMNICAYVPYPLIYGAVVDSTCLVWEEHCGSTGNCWIYDLSSFRYLLHLVTVGFLAVGCCFHVAVAVYSRRLKNIYSDEVEEEETKTDRTYLTAITQSEKKEKSQTSDEGFKLRNG